MLNDTFGRRFPYLRLSLTDVCNFKCSYCLPNGYQKTHDRLFLSTDELLRVVRAFTRLGVWKFRLTGGEPTVRHDFLNVTRAVAQVDGVHHLAFTTNGYQLAEYAKQYKQAGVHAINISIDSLTAQGFERITGNDCLNAVLQGVSQCLALGFKRIKINTVLLRGLNDHELDDFIDFVSDKPLSLRFIELMRTGDNHSYFLEHHLSGSVVSHRLIERGWSVLARTDGAGPAVEYGHPSSQGTVGIIAPYSKDFCSTCNRLRVSAKGELHLCLFGDGGYNLRPLLQHDNQQAELQTAIRDALGFKTQTHRLHEQHSGVRQHLASIGG